MFGTIIISHIKEKVNRRRGKNEKSLSHGGRGGIQDNRRERCRTAETRRRLRPLAYGGKVQASFQKFFPPCTLQTVLFFPRSEKKKDRPIGLSFFYGEREIRTLGRVLAYTRFPVVRLRPAQPSLHSRLLATCILYHKRDGLSRAFLNFFGQF